MEMYFKIKAILLIVGLDVMGILLLIDIILMIYDIFRDKKK